MKLREPIQLNPQIITDKIYKMLVKKHSTEKKRDYLGLSYAGEKCERKLWLSYKGYEDPSDTDGRLLRLFRRGGLEEIQMAKDLRAIGIKLKETGNNQREVVATSKVKGHLDGIIYGGVPEAPNKMHIWECKTHNKKNFDTLVKDGVEKAFPKHYAQMQCYMYLTNIDRALYTAICKDDDRIYTERVRLDKNNAVFLINRLIAITNETRLPPPLSTNPTWYECKYCPYYTYCFGDNYKEIEQYA